jgi:hypothetical protein
LLDLVLPNQSFERDGAKSSAAPQLKSLGVEEPSVNFEHELKAICNTKGGPYLRPFRPNVAWAHSKAWIVGSNPATPLRQEFRSFDEYWDSLTKNPDVFERTYANARGDEDSKTTKRVKELCAELCGINYLVTNACAYPVAHNGRVPAEQWAIGEQIFRGLLICCEPKVIFAHGTKAQRLVERVFGVALDPSLILIFSAIQRINACSSVRHIYQELA